MSDEKKFLSSELDHYEAKERTGHYLKVFNGDEQDRDLTLLIRDDQWQSVGGQDYLMYQASAVSITREDALALAEWINERFK
jgi:hypothetical protein